METHGAQPLDLAAIQAVRVNVSATLKRAQELGTRRSFKGESQVAAYLRAISCMDLTTLTGADTEERVRRLCAKALRPVNQEILAELGIPEHAITVGAVCVYHEMIDAAVKALRGKIPVAAVATGFPAGQIPRPLKLHEIDYAILAGATEIDVVISRALVHHGEWRRLYDEIASFRKICGTRAKLKTILGVGDLLELEKVAKASLVAIMAGSDFIKTSTGYEPTNASLETGLVMVRAIRASGLRVGFKPAGGIKTAKDALVWLSLMREELGEDWTKPDLFRIGASSLLADIERQLSHCATGRYSAHHHHPMS